MKNNSPLVIAALVLTGAVWTLGQSTQAQSLAEKQFTKLCKSCHGLDGKGNPEKAKALKIKPALLDFGRPEASKLARNELKEIVLKGKNKMPAYERKLKPTDVDFLVDLAVRLREALADSGEAK